MLRRAGAEQAHEAAHGAEHQQQAARVLLALRAGDHSLQQVHAAVQHFLAVILRTLLRAVAAVGLRVQNPAARGLPRSDSNIIAAMELCATGGVDCNVAQSAASLSGRETCTGCDVRLCGVACWTHL